LESFGIVEALQIIPSLVKTGGVGALAGGVLSLYSADSAGVATADMAKILKQLYQLNMSAKGAADGSSGNQLKKYSKEPPVKSTKLKNDQGWRDKDGNIWKKDMKHKDHWDLSDEKTGKKVKEVDFDENQIWPEGPKNKNKN